MQIIARLEVTGGTGSVWYVSPWCSGLPSILTKLLSLERYEDYAQMVSNLASEKS